MQVTVKGRFIGGGLYQPKENGKYSACVVLEPGEEAKLRKAAQEAIEEKWGSKKPKGLKNWVIRKGDDEDYEHSFERFFINPKSNEKVPVIRGPHNQETEDVYPGCYVFVSVNTYAFDAIKDSPPGVTTGLRAVKFWKDGDPIGNRYSDSEFDGYESEDEVDAEAYGDDVESMM